MACFWRRQRAPPVAPDTHCTSKKAVSARIHELEQQFEAEVWMALKYPPDRVGNEYHMHNARTVAYEILKLYTLLINDLIIDHASDPIPQYQSIRKQIVQRLDSPMPLSPRLCIAQV